MTNAQSDQSRETATIEAIAIDPVSCGFRTTTSTVQATQSRPLCKDTYAQHRNSVCPYLSIETDEKTQEKRRYCRNN